jgi:hypothetical protein
MAVKSLITLAPGQEGSQGFPICFCFVLATSALVFVEVDVSQN